VDSTRVLVAGQPRWLHDCLTEPAFLLVLCGHPGGWDELALDTLRSRYGDVLAIRRLTADHGREDPDLLVTSTASPAADWESAGPRTCWCAPTVTSPPGSQDAT